MSAGNKKGKASDFLQSEDILKDLLYGVRKSNLTNETRSFYHFIQLILHFLLPADLHEKKSRMHGIIALSN